MSYWSHNPELLDEITIEALPDEWKNKIMEGEIELLDVPEAIRDKAMLEGEKEYWANRIDEVKMQLKERRLFGNDPYDNVKTDEDKIDPM